MDCWPTITDAGAQTTVSELVAFEIEIVADGGGGGDGLLLESVRDDAETNAEPALIADTVIEHVNDEIEHDVALSDTLV